MSKFSSVMARAALGAVFCSLALPGASLAHGLAGGYDPARPALEYVWLGIWHMLAGWDHLLFIAGILLLAGSIRTAAKLISLFVLGHSVTLLTATLAGWRIDPTLVDAVIALSLVWVGLEGYRRKLRELRLTGAIVLAFGLVHGLGLSTRLQDLGLPESGVAIRVILFNVGVEIGQLVALGAIVGVGTLLARRLANPVRVSRYAFVALAAAGLVAAAVISFPGADQTSERASASDACVETETPPPPGLAAGGHPRKSFYGPTETAPIEDLTHVVGDGYVIVRYRPDLADRQLEALEGLTTGNGPQYVIAAPDPRQQSPVRAITANRRLTCSEVDTQAITQFRDDWLASLR